MKRDDVRVGAAYAGDTGFGLLFGICMKRFKQQAHILTAGGLFAVDYAKLRPATKDEIRTLTLLSKP